VTEEEIARISAKIAVMTREEMARFRRFAPSEDPIIQTPVLWARFEQRFRELGGFSPEISKRIGWR
jgi:hypothetical protein